MGDLSSDVGSVPPPPGVLGLNVLVRGLDAALAQQLHGGVGASDLLQDTEEPPHPLGRAYLVTQAFLFPWAVGHGGSSLGGTVAQAVRVMKEDGLYVVFMAPAALRQGKPAATSEVCRLAPAPA